MTETATEVLAPAIPLAETLDEPTLRRVFANAPADLAVPRDVRSLFRARMRAVGGSRRSTYLTAWIGALVAGPLLGIAFGSVLGWIVTGGALLIAGIVLYRAHSSASDDFFGRYATARGLVPSPNPYVGAKVPLFRQGDKREWSRVLQGTIAGQPGSLAHYTYTTVTRDSEGNESETDHDYTVVHFPLPEHVAQRFVGVSLSPKSLSFGALQDKLAHDRKVELESAEFHKRYSLRVVDSQDDIALYELFSTTFVQTLSTTLQIYWEQRSGDLVVWRKGHETEAADLDRMCLEAWHVLHRYLEEYR